MNILPIEKRNKVLRRMSELIAAHSESLLIENKKDIDTFVRQDDVAMYDRLIIDTKKVDGMIESLRQLANQDDPLHIERFSFTHENGIEISNKTTAFGTVLIIYESRPDVTIEAGGIAFKSGNKILLKGGKESINSNNFLVSLWKKALAENEVNADWILYLNYNRTETQEFLKNPNQKIDLIIPRGGEKLIEFVKQNATAPVIVSGRGNNFVYVDKDCDTNETLDIIINAKTAKISACNALDKVLIDKNLENKDAFISVLISKLMDYNVEIYADDYIKTKQSKLNPIKDDSIWHEEFLDLKIVIALTENTDTAIQKINTFSGGHSASICTTNKDKANYFMNEVDCAAVYHNASTRFTDGFQFGLGGELAISTDKLHQRGPIGLQHLVTNKWYVKGNGQIR